MQQAVLYTPGQSAGAAGSVAFAEIPVPSRAPRGHALVRIASAGECGTDLHIIAGRISDEFITGLQPRVLGHEGSGYVIQLADDEDDETRQAIRIGDLVVLQPIGYCGRCVYCSSGRYNLCSKCFAEHLGYNWNGTWQSVLQVPLSRIHPVRTCVGGWVDLIPSADWAVLAEPLSSVLNGLNRVGHLPCTSRTLVTGAGIIGLLACATLRRRGIARVTVSEPNPDRRRRVADVNEVIGGLTTCEPGDELNAATGAAAYDLVVECSGSPEAAARACEVAGNAGRVLLLGICGSDGQLVLEPLAGFNKELTVLTAIANRYTVPEAIGFLSQVAQIEGFSLELLGVQRLPLAEYETGLRLMREGKVAKVLLQP